jgi:beta-glucanase (GH16 family)
MWHLPIQAQQEQNERELPTEKFTKKERAKRTHKGWRLVWSDEFSGEELDKTSWSRCLRYGSPWNRHMSLLDSLVKVQNGVIELWGVNRPEGYQDSLKFLTGGVDSRGLRSIKNGRIDVRARLDCAQGFWPAIWMMPESNLPWPEAGEIDIMEHLNFDDYIYQTVHSGHIEGLRKPKTQHDHKEKVDVTIFNIYSVEITPNEIIYYINNRKTFSYPRLDPEPEGQYPFDDYEYYMILSAQLGGHWIGPIEAEQLPVKMEVDYVRFYEKK